VVFLDGTRGANAIVQRRILHAFHNGLATGIDFFGVVRSKGGRNGRPVIHPPFQFELAHHLGAIRFGPALRHLIAPDVGFVQVVDKVDGQFDQKVALGLGVVRIVQPVVKVGFVAEPQHGVTAILNPKGLFPLFHDNGAKGNAGQDVSLFADQFGFG
jgi:hypothetical protein